MKILFVLENLTCRCGANVNIALRLAKRLSERHEVCALTRESADKPLDPQKVAVFAEVTACPVDGTDRLAAFLRRVEWDSASGPKRACALLTHPRMLARLLDGKYRGCKGMRGPLQRALEALCRAHAFDVVVTVAAPYYLAQILADARVGEAKKVLLQLDPYTHNYSLPQKHTAKRQALERRVAACMDRLLAVSFVADELAERQVLSDLDRVVPFELPGIDPDAPLPAPAPHTDGTVRFAFVGQLYPRIREPRFLLELFCRLPANYVLYLVGGGEEATVAAYRERLGARLVCHGWVSSEEAAAQVAAADVLINLNNSVSNQMPSKILEYINTGKPLLNICKLADCPSLKYTAKYANGTDVLETVEPREAARLVTAFVTARKGTVIPRAEILSDFSPNTDAHLTELFERELTKLLSIGGPI